MAEPVAAVAAVAIGRNEGDRLTGCLASLKAQRLSPVVYVDSGSTDGSVEAARRQGAEIVELDMSAPFTAARARNAGAERVAEMAPGTMYIQFVDSDCELAKGWISAATGTFEGAPDLAVVCGRRRERFPEASLWNRLIDAEWNTPVGEVEACGGDALIRRAALDAVGGYREDIIAGEEPEMCLRMREVGWRICRIDAEMTLHDAAMTRFGQWWQRARRAGHAYAEGAALHGSTPRRYKVAETRRALLWGAGLPAAGLLGAGLLTPWFVMFPVLGWGAHVARLVIIRSEEPARALFLTLGKIPEAQGVLGYWVGRLTDCRSGLIEYK